MLALNDSEELNEPETEALVLALSDSDTLIEPETD